MNGKLGVARAVAFEPMAHGAQFGVRVALAGQTRSVHIWVLTTELLTHKKYILHQKQNSFELTESINSIKNRTRLYEGLPT